jgi:hypothetical protein
VFIKILFAAHKWTRRIQHKSIANNFFSPKSLLQAMQPEAKTSGAFVGSRFFAEARAELRSVCCVATTVTSPIFKTNLFSI